MNSEHSQIRFAEKNRMLDSILGNMADVTDLGVSLEKLSVFLRFRCECFQYNGTDVIIICQDHSEDLSVSPIEEALARAINTKVILVEYFEPELEANAKNFPLLGKVVSKMFEDSQVARVKTLFSNQFAEIAKETGKPIAVADIANKAEYYYGYSAIPTVLLFVSAAIPEMRPAILAYFSIYGINRIQESVSKGGFFDPTTIHEYEKILFDIEDARKVFVAKGLEQLSEEYASNPHERNRILACYPRAHAMRIKNYLVNQDLSLQASKSIKEKLYKTYPALDYSVRQYVWKDLMARMLGTPSLAGWKQISNRSLL